MAHRSFAMEMPQYPMNAKIVIYIVLNLRLKYSNAINEGEKEGGEKTDDNNNNNTNSHTMNEIHENDIWKSVCTLLFFSSSQSDLHRYISTCVTILIKLDVKKSAENEKPKYEYVTVSIHPSVHHKLFSK